MHYLKNLSKIVFINLSFKYWL